MGCNKIVKRRAVQRNCTAFSAQRRKEEGVGTLAFIENSRALVVAFTTLVRLSVLFTICDASTQAATHTSFSQEVNAI